MYGWATPDYLLNHMSLTEILEYYENGIKFEESKAQILVGTLAKEMGNGSDDPKKPAKRIYREEPEQSPDREALYEQFGDVIKT